MTTASSAGAYRPAAPPISTSPPRLPKRRAPSASSEKPHPEESTSKRQKIQPPGSSAAAAPFLKAVDQISPTIQQFRQPREAQARKVPPQLVNGFFLGSEGIEEPLPQSSLHDRSSPPSLPQTPWKRNLRLRSITEGTLNNSGVRKRTDMQVQRVPYKAGPPKGAPVFTTNKEADFAPWMGCHAEDALNDQTVKHGFIDKTLVSQSETSTARQSLYGIFKHRGGLQTLSALFSAAAEERQNHSRIAASAASGPPPRVTLTEARKKAFLNDLADPNVPLRKLIRTIPQGIKGQNLLDQCFTNNVPIGRALWFAKCVGANEIRSLRRKGTNASSATAAESRWLRDWTSNVELFVESSLEQCGQPGWRQTMNYALNLAAGLYLDSLLDRDHYLDWITKSTSTASLARLPIWLLLVRFHQIDLIGNRRRGRSLVENLLEVLQVAVQEGQDPLKPLAAKLNHTIKWFMQTDLSCFILPQSWKKHQGCIARCFNLQDNHDVQLFHQLSHRNEKIDPFSSTNTASTKPPRQIIIEMLDAVKPPYELAKIATQCRSACDDLTVLVDVVLEWSSSRFRAGKFRLHLVVRLLKIWQGECDIHDSVVRFFASQETGTACDIESMNLLVSALVRAQVLSVGRYLQWLTARGGLENYSFKSSLSPSQSTQGTDSDSIRFAAVQVLAAIPLSCLQPAVKNLRNIMLCRAGFSLAEEADRIEAGKAYVASRLPSLYFTPAIGNNTTRSALPPSGLEGSAKAAVAEFFRQRILPPTASFQTKVDGEETKTNGSTLDDTGFRSLRSICEGLDESALLVDIIKENIMSDDEDLLASVTDTVNYHLDVFYACGEFGYLHSQLFQTYLSKRASNQFPRHFLESLICLAAAFPSSRISVSSLWHDLARGEKALPVAACSPVSDGMAESLQHAGPTFTDEFEAVLASGDRMEEQTMAQLFNVLADRLEKSQYQIEAESDDVLCALYARLRIFRISQFDRLISAWLQKLVSATDSRVQQLFPALIKTGCTSFRACVDMLLEALHQDEASSGTATPAQIHAADFLYAVDEAEEKTDSASYRLKLENTRHFHECPDRAMELRAKVRYARVGTCPKTSMDSLIHLTVNLKNAREFQRSDLSRIINAEIKRLLHLPAEATDATPSLLLELIKKTTDLSMPFCCLRLRTLAITLPSMSVAAEHGGIVQILEDFSRFRGDDAWLCYLTALGPEAARQMHENTRDAFFATMILPVSGRTAPTACSISRSYDQASNQLRILSQTAFSMTSAEARASLPLLLERFTAALRALFMRKYGGPKIDQVNQEIELSDSIDESLQADVRQLSVYLDPLLRMVSIQWVVMMSPGAEPLFSPNPSHKQAQQEVVKMLIILASIGLHPSLDSHAEVVTHIFDVMAMMVDGISDDARMVCSRILKDKVRDQRVEYLFGTAKSISKDRSGLCPHKNNWLGCTLDVLRISKDGKRGREYKLRNWEMLEGGAEASVSLSLFDARKEM